MTHPDKRRRRRNVRIAEVRRDPRLYLMQIFESNIGEGLIAFQFDRVFQQLSINSGSGLRALQSAGLSYMGVLREWRVAKIRGYMKEGKSFLEQSVLLGCSKSEIEQLVKLI